MRFKKLGKYAQSNSLLAALLALCITRLWLMLMPSSLWVDEMATVFVVRRGAADPSLAIVPQVPASLYYWLPRIADHLFGFSEIGYRLPSILAMGIALWLVARLAARLIHPAAGWFAAVCCLALRPLNYFAVDARPYALGICTAVAALWFLIRWLDTASWRNSLLFIGCAALVWWIHLIYWPFYLSLFLYALARLLRRNTPVGWGHAAAVFCLLGLLLAPVLLQAMSLAREAQKHVIVRLPTRSDFLDSLQVRLIMTCGIWAAILHTVFRWKDEPKCVPAFSLLLVAGWWLSQPLCLLLFSYATGNSVFVPRYMSLSLPAIALAATAVVSYFMPKTYWKPAAAILAVAVLVTKCDWHHLWPIHDSNWRDAARAANQAAIGSDSPVICPSPFIEAQWPVWRPDYPVSDFLYCQLLSYPIHGRICPFPLKSSSEAEHYADTLARTVFPAAGRFMIYGGRWEVDMWRNWFAARPDFANWSNRSLGTFEQVEAVIFVRGSDSKSP
jgi:uncharacterized membrane protein